MNKAEFLARCSNAYDCGLITEERMRLMESWLDVVMREGHSRVCDIRLARSEYHQDQWNHVNSFWTGYPGHIPGPPQSGEVGRLLRNSKRDFGGASEPSLRICIATLANDADGYALIQFAAILTQRCQRCACDPNAAWTRGCHCRNPQGATPEEDG